MPNRGTVERRYRYFKLKAGLGLTVFAKVEEGIRVIRRIILNPCFSSIRRQ